MWAGLIVHVSDVFVGSFEKTGLLTGHDDPAGGSGQEVFKNLTGPVRSGPVRSGPVRSG